MSLKLTAAVIWGSDSSTWLAATLLDASSADLPAGHIRVAEAVRVEGRAPSRCALMNRWPVAPGETVQTLIMLPSDISSRIEIVDYVEVSSVHHAATGEIELGIMGAKILEGGS